MQKCKKKACGLKKVIHILKTKQTKKKPRKIRDFEKCNLVKLWLLQVSLWLWLFIVNGFEIAELL